MVPTFAAIALNVSPLFTVYVVKVTDSLSLAAGSLLLSGTLFLAPGNFNFCPTAILLIFAMLFSFANSATVVPTFAAIALNVSPLFTVYVVKAGELVSSALGASTTFPLLPSVTPSANFGLQI